MRSEVEVRTPTESSAGAVRTQLEVGAARFGCLVASHRGILSGVAVGWGEFARRPGGDGDCGCEGLFPVRGCAIRRIRAGGSSAFEFSRS